MTPFSSTRCAASARLVAATTPSVQAGAIRLTLVTVSVRPDAAEATPPGAANDDRRPLTNTRWPTCSARSTPRSAPAAGRVVPSRGALRRHWDAPRRSQHRCRARPCSSPASPRVLDGRARRGVRQCPTSRPTLGWPDAHAVAGRIRRRCPRRGGPGSRRAPARGTQPVALITSRDMVDPAIAPARRRRMNTDRDRLPLTSAVHAASRSASCKPRSSMTRLRAHPLPLPAPGQPAACTRHRRAGEWQRLLHAVTPTQVGGVLLARRVGRP